LTGNPSALGASARHVETEVGRNGSARLLGRLSGGIPGEPGEALLQLLRLLLLRRFFELLPEALGELAIEEPVEQAEQALRIDLQDLRIRRGYALISPA
jgi:hypothetical protein